MKDNKYDTEFNNIFNSIMKADTIRQIKIKIRELDEQNSNINQKCGTCYYWMKSNCNREKGHKVSCNERKCDAFKLGTGYEELITKNENKIKELRSKIFNFR